MEVNARLQVEHTVTEEVTGIITKCTLSLLNTRTTWTYRYDINAIYYHRHKLDFITVFFFLVLCALQFSICVVALERWKYVIHHEKHCILKTSWGVKRFQVQVEIFRVFNKLIKLIAKFNYFTLLIDNWSFQASTLFKPRYEWPRGTASPVLASPRHNSKSRKNTTYAYKTK